MRITSVQLYSLRRAWRPQQVPQGACTRQDFRWCPFREPFRIFVEQHLTSCCAASSSQQVLADLNVWHCGAWRLSLLTRSVVDPLALLAAQRLLSMRPEQFEKTMRQCVEILLRDGLAQPSSAAVQAHVHCACPSVAPSHPSGHLVMRSMSKH